MEYEEFDVWGNSWDDEYVDNRITLNGRPVTTDDVEVLLDEEERRS